MSIVETLVSLRRAPVIGAISNIGLKILGVEFPRSVVTGPGLMLPHGSNGLVVHEQAVIGANVKIYQGVTLGRSDTYLPDQARAVGGGIVVEDDVVIGAGAVVLFQSGRTVTIGRAAVVGANAVVLQSVPPREIWAGNPARKVSDRRR